MIARASSLIELHDRRHWLPGCGEQATRSAQVPSIARHMLMFGGRWRDSAWYSITDDEWPRVRELLSERLAAQLTTT